MASDVSSDDAPSGGVSSGGGTATRDPHSLAALGRRFAKALC